MLQTDSIQTITEAGEELEVAQYHHTLTPAQVIRWLPKDATPAQQDSAIQAHFQPVIVEVSQRPDTLHMPGIPFSKTFVDSLSEPLSERSVFKDSPLFSTELGREEPGVAGETIPYSIAGDNIMTGMLMLCFIITISAIRNVYNFFVDQLKSFFFVQQSETTDMVETTSERRSQTLLAIITSLTLALLFFFFIRDKKEGLFVIDQYQVIGVFLAVFIGYFLVKQMLYGLVDAVFFDRKNNRQWNRARMFLIVSEGLLLLPIVYVQAFFDLYINTTLIYAVSVVILFKLLTFYKHYIIFFSKKGQILQNILYFCMLELAPLSILWGALMIISGYLKVKY